MIRTEDLEALANIAKHTLDWDHARFVDEAEEDPGRLCVEVGRSLGCTRDEMGEEFIYDEVFLAVHSDSEDKTYEVTVKDCTIHEAIDLLNTMSRILGL